LTSDIARQPSHTATALKHCSSIYAAIVLAHTNTLRTHSWHTVGHKDSRTIARRGLLESVAFAKVAPCSWTWQRIRDSLGFNSACNFINVFLPSTRAIFHNFCGPNVNPSTIRWRNKLNLCASAHESTQKCCQRHWQSTLGDGRCLRTPGGAFTHHPHHPFHQPRHGPFVLWPLTLCSGFPFASINKFCKCAHKTYEIAKIYFISHLCGSDKRLSSAFPLFSWLIWGPGYWAVILASAVYLCLWLVAFWR